MYENDEKGKVTPPHLEEISEIEKENLFSKYVYAPSSSSYKGNSSSLKSGEPMATNTQLDMKEISEKCNSISDCELPVERNEVAQKNPSSGSHEILKNNHLKSTSSVCGEEKALNQTLDDDFQECEIASRAKYKVSNKKDEDSSFICMMCQNDLTHLNLEERSIHVNQCIDHHSSIETSSQESSSVVFILECPLCFRHFPSPEVRSTHIKRCGKSRGLSIQSVIQAIQLQEKHILERRALGLPLNNKAKPVKQVKKPAVKKFTIEPKSAMQSDLQLAKALSLSLKDNETQSQVKFLSTYSEDVSVSVLQAPVEFQNPGRAVSRKKKAMSHTPLLLLRTEEERKRIIQEKVNAVIASSIKPDISCETTDRKEKSVAEQKISYLWDLSSKAADKDEYYVEQLLDWIKPSDIEIGSKLCNLSQIPGHRIFTQLPCDYTFSCTDKNDETGVTSESNSPSSLISSLQSLIGNSWMSNVDIHTASGIVIPAHKLLLALRCPSLKNAFSEPVEGGKYILNWENTSFDAALHFLNFIYTGSTEWEEEIIEELSQLAKKYKVDDLLNILSSSCETLELLMNEDPKIGFPDETAMDTNITFIDNNKSVYDSNFQKDFSFLQSEKMAIDNTEGIDSVAADCIKESEDYSVQSSTDFDMITQKDNTILKTHNFQYSSSEDINVECILGKQSYFEDKELSNFSKDKGLECNDSKAQIISSTFESCSTHSNSSNDSIKILKTTGLSECNVSPGMSRENNPNRNLMFTEMSSKENTTEYIIPKKISHNTPQTEIFLENTISPNSSPPSLYSRISKDNFFSEKKELPSTSESKDDIIYSNVKDDIVLVEEFVKKTDTNSGRNSNFILKGMDYESPQKNYKSPSNLFSNEVEDFDAVIFSSQNITFQDQHIEDYESKLGFKSPIAFEKNLYSSPERINFSQHCSKLQVEGERNKVCDTSSTNNSFCDNKFEMNVFSSPEILVSDSDDDDSRLVLGKNYFKKHESFSEAVNSTPFKVNKTLSPTIEKKKNPLPDIICCDSNSNDIDDEIKIQSLNKENDDVSDEFFFTQRERILGKDCFTSTKTEGSSLNQNSPSEKNTLPEIIYCDSNSNDNENDVTSELDAFNEDHISAPIDCEYLQNRKLKASPFKSPKNTFSMMSSPESPWKFQTDKSFQDFKAPKKLVKSFKSSVALSQISTAKTLKSYSEKHKNTSSPTKIQTNKKTDTSSLTPKGPVAKFKISDSPITPLPDYRNMMTPEIKEALKKIGVKALPRKKAVAVLSHVYDETHPWNDGLSDNLEQNLKSASQSSSKTLNHQKALSLPKKRKQVTEICDRTSKKMNKCRSSAAQNPNEIQNKTTRKAPKPSSSSPVKGTKDCLNSSQENISSSPNGSINSREGDIHSMSVSSEFSDSSQPNSKGNIELIKEYILSNEDLYLKILNYTPINLSEFQQELKENGMTIGLKKLMDYLDEQCIIFTLPRKEEYKKKQQVRTQQFRKRMIAKLSQQGSSNQS